MSRRARPQARIARDRARVARLHLQGADRAEIARRLGLSRAQVDGDLAAVRAAWRRSAIRDFNEAVGRELAKTDKLEQTYREAWEASCQRDKPDARFLEGIERCIRARRGLLGLDGARADQGQERTPVCYRVVFQSAPQARDS